MAKVIVLLVVHITRKLRILKAIIMARKRFVRVSRRHDSAHSLRSISKDAGRSQSSANLQKPKY